MKMHIAGGILALTLLVGCATDKEPEYKGSKGETSYNDLPTAVQKTIKYQAPNAEIADINKQTLNGTSFYEFTLAEGGKNRRLRVAEDGTIITTQEWIYETSGAARVPTK